jgi:hypothetical protein
MTNRAGTESSNEQIAPEAAAQAATVPADT